MHSRKTHPVVVAAALGLLVVTTPSSTRATPYASGITNNAGTVSFILNESADNVKVIFDGGGAGKTNDLGALPKGVASFSLGTHTSWEIHVTKSSALVWTQISDDTNVFNQFYAPRSTDVNRNPASPFFGRVYVLEHAGSTSPIANGAGRTVSKGIYALNADLSDAIGQGDTALTGGLETYTLFQTLNNRYEPWKISVGADDNLYIAEAQDPRGGIARVDGNLANGEIVLEGVGNTTAPTIHTVVYGMQARGSQAGSDLTVYGLDGQWSGGGQTLLRWNIGNGSLPHNVAPTVLANMGLPAVELETDLDIAPDGNIYAFVYRAVTDIGAVQVYSATGTLLWNSKDGGTDLFLNACGLKVSPDNTKLAIARRDRQTWIVGLTNGPSGYVPNAADITVVATFTGGSSNGRNVTWDAAGNLYAANQSDELLRVFSPGGSRTAITKSDGTFALAAPSKVVSVTASTPTANEAGPVNGAFTLTRTGDLGLPLTVNYTVGGTATSGTDYVALPGSVTFQVGAISTNIAVAVTGDSEAEFTETVILTVAGSPDYAIGSGLATVNLLDDEPATISIAPATSETRLLEGYSAQKLGFTLTRKGLLSSAPTVNLGYSGAATPGADFNGPASVALAADTVTADFSITPIDDDSYEGNETLNIAIAAGSGYTSGTPSAASVTVIEDDYPPGTVLFADNFDADSSAAWAVNAFDSGNATATFAEDYSVTGYVPPSKPGATTKGLVFRANLAPNLSRNAISASPLGLSLTNGYRLRFKAWNNYNGPLFQGGAGSTYHLTGGVGTTGDHAQFQFGSADGIWFDMGGDGASSSAIGDTSAYADITLLNGDYGVYAAAGTEAETPRLSGNPYYSIWGSIQAPPAQVTAFPDQAGTSEIGSFGVSWHTFVVGYETNTVYWVIDGIPMASVTNTFATLGPNVFVGWADNFDNNATSFPDPAAMSFGIIDDLRVETIPATPIKITGIQVLGSNVEVTFTGPAAKVAADFRLQSAGTVNGSYTDDNSATPSDVASGSFKFTTARNGDSRFYKIKL